MGHVAGMGEMRNAHSILVRKPKGKRPLVGRHNHICEDNIKMDLKRYRVAAGFIWLMIMIPVAGVCEHSNEPSGCH
jgi:hypothetical protein